MVGEERDLVMDTEPMSGRQTLQYGLRQLRWLLTSYRMGGLQYWPGAVPVEGPASEPCAVDVDIDIDTEDTAKRLAVLCQEIGDCKRCRLHQSRTKLVFGDGSPAARLLFVGEAPGYDEDRQGLPFVGRAGRLLNKMIQAMGMRRSEVYICNVVKCRPPQNRNPQEDEVESCSPFLFRQIETIRPKVICLLGSYAAQTLLQTGLSISQLRGKERHWHGIPVVATFHPAYLLRNPAQKASTWLDLVRVMELMHEGHSTDESDERTP
jgi:uracil-DNA glycosylase family 4